MVSFSNGSSKVERWLKPPIGTLKLNFDACSSKDSEHAGQGALNWD